MFKQTIYDKLQDDGEMNNRPSSIGTSTLNTWNDESEKNELKKKQTHTHTH